MTTTKRIEHFMEFIFASASAINHKNLIAQNPTKLYTKCKLKGEFRTKYYHIGETNAELFIVS